MKICMYPNQAELGIGRVVEAYLRYLPPLGFEFVSDEDQADIVSVHAGHQTGGRQPEVHHCHGLYPTATVDKGKEILYTWNADVIENARVAHIITTPSDWVADLFRRDMLLEPVVVPHGIDVGEWEYAPKRNGPILWAKGHNPGVCDPNVLTDLATKLPNRSFVTTFGNQMPNVSVIGKQNFEDMKTVLRDCGVYLAVTKETFGIQTLEAMACGKPVLGYNWGGTADIVTHGYDGYLVEPGDIDGLVKGLEWILDYYDDAALNARNTVEEDYAWELIIRKVAWVYEQAAFVEHTSPRVSVVIPCYNYADFVGKAIESALGQDYDDMEVIVVNDGSTDKSLETIQQYADRVVVINIENSGVAEARNCGIRHAQGEYITCLDADDQMYQGTIRRFVEALDKDRGLGIVYGGLDMYLPGPDVTRKGAWPPDFCFKRQSLPKSNQVPSCCMFRRSIWERVGGYRAKYTPAEDAELWLRITAAGYNAKKITEDATYLYMAHEGSLSRRIKEPDYTADKPWSGRFDLTPFAAPACDYKYDSFPVRNYDDPWVSVIIPVADYHADIVWRAVDSVLAQSMPYWECIVVPNGCDDIIVQPSTGIPLHEAYPFIKIHYIENANVAAARNYGANIATGDFLVFLDADDWLLSDYLLNAIGAFNEVQGESYIYTDWYSTNGKNGALKPNSRAFECERLKGEALHPITALIPKAWHDAIGGFDEELTGWEDWDYYLKLVLNEGHCGVRYPQPLIVYSSYTGMRRDDSYIKKSELLPEIKGRYEGIMCRRCPEKTIMPRISTKPPVVARGVIEKAVAPIAVPRGFDGRPVIKPIAAGGRAAPIPVTAKKVKGEQQVSEKDMIEVIENSGNIAKHGVIGVATRRDYGRKKHGERFSMHVNDQRLQPHLYIPVPSAVQAPAPAEVERPVVPTVSRPPKPPAPKKAEVPVKAPTKEYVEKLHPSGSAPTALPPADQVELLQEYNADVDGIDITILPLQAIRMLNLQGEDAADAYLAEEEGPARDEILDYLIERPGIENFLDFEEV